MRCNELVLNQVDRYVADIDQEQVLSLGDCSDSMKRPLARATKTHQHQAQ